MPENKRKEVVGGEYRLVDSGLLAVSMPQASFGRLAMKKVFQNPVENIHCFWLAFMLRQ
jgi:hypothetical protein